MPISGAPGGLPAATGWRQPSTAAARTFPVVTLTVGFRFTPAGTGVRPTRPPKVSGPACASTLSVNLTGHGPFLAGPAIWGAPVSQGHAVHCRRTVDPGARHGRFHRHVLRGGR